MKTEIHCKYKILAIFQRLSMKKIKHLINNYILATCRNDIGLNKIHIKIKFTYLFFNLLLNVATIKFKIIHVGCIRNSQYISIGQCCCRP